MGREGGGGGLVQHVSDHVVQDSTVAEVSELHIRVKAHFHFEEKIRIHLEEKTNK